MNDNESSISTLEDQPITNEMILEIKEIIRTPTDFNTEIKSSLNLNVILNPIRPVGMGRIPPPPPLPSLSR